MNALLKTLLLTASISSSHILAKDAGKTSAQHANAILALHDSQNILVDREVTDQMEKVCTIEGQFILSVSGRGENSKEVHDKLIVQLNKIDAIAARNTDIHKHQYIHNADTGDSEDIVYTRVLTFKSTNLSALREFFDTLKSAKNELLKSSDKEIEITLLPVQYSPTSKDIEEIYTHLLAQIINKYTPRYIQINSFEIGLVSGLTATEGCMCVMHVSLSCLMSSEKFNIPSNSPGEKALTSAVNEEIVAKDQQNASQLLDSNNVKTVAKKEAEEVIKGVANDVIRDLAKQTDSNKTSNTNTNQQNAPSAPKTIPTATQPATVL